MIGLQSSQAIRRQARACAATAAHLWEMPFQIEARRENVQDACMLQRVTFPVSKYGIYPEMMRTQAPEWWGRQLKKADRRTAETIELKAGRIKHYCSDLILHGRKLHREQMAELLSRMVAICEMENGEKMQIELAELVKGSNSNPAIRRAELMTRIRGFEEYAKTVGDVPYFFTMTCPSKYHRNKGKDWNGATPREAQAYLCDVWAKVRTSLKRAELQPYGFRIAEPHKDACPHWHALLWFKSHHDARRAKKIIRDYFLAEDMREPGAFLRRVTAERIDSSKGSATGYIAKYICKNIDGVYTDKTGDEFGFDDKRRNENGDMEKTGKNSFEAAQRVDAWASCWGIRQFQQIGGPSVAAWRELRRLMPMDERNEIEKIAEPLREAADRGQWDLFTALDIEHREKYGDKVRAWSETSMDKMQEAVGRYATPEEAAAAWQAMPEAEQKACLNPWHEPTLRRIKGVVVAGWMKIKTRFHKWVLMMKEADATKEVRDGIQQRRLETLREIQGIRAELEAPELFAAQVKGLEVMLRLFDFEAGAAPPRWPLEFCQ